MIWTETHNGEPVPVQYDLRRDPWRLLVACTLLRRTGGHAVKPVLDALFDRVNASYLAYGAMIEDVEYIIKPCGLQHTKAVAIKSISGRWVRDLESRWRYPTSGEVREWDHVGEYVAQSYEIFVERSIIPYDRVSDHVLADWQTSKNGIYFRQWGTLPPREETT